MKNAKKLTSILMVASVTMVLFSGCGSKTATTSTADTTSTTADSSTTTDKKNGATSMKTLYTTVLKGLVTDKTITQTQSDKVLEIVAKEPTDGAKTGGIAPTDGTAPTSGTKPTGTPPTDGTKPKTDGTKPTGTAPKDGGTKPKNDRLTELVTSKVITQAQADTINTKVQEAMKSAQTN